MKNKTNLYKGNRKDNGEQIKGFLIKIDDKCVICNQETNFQFFEVVPKTLVNIKYDIGEKSSEMLITVHNYEDSQSHNHIINQLSTVEYNKIFELIIDAIENIKNDYFHSLEIYPDGNNSAKSFAIRQRTDNTISLDYSDGKYGRDSVYIEYDDKYFNYRVAYFLIYSIL